KPNPVVSTVLQGKRYVGIAYVVNAWYVTSYDPIRDKSGKIIGMFYTGIKQESVEEVRNAIQNFQLGKSGQIFVLGGKGDQQGKLIISETGQQDGEVVWDAKDASGKPYIQEIVQSALSFKPRETRFVRYTIPTPEGTKTKLIAYAYYAPWDWVIGISADEAEFLGAVGRLEAGQSQMTRTIFWVGLFFAAVSAGAMFWFGRSVARPLQQAVSVATAIAQGRLDQDITHRSSDETGRLAEAFRGMLQYLRQMATSARQIAQGDLSSEVKPVSPHDELGNAFQSMSDYLRQMASSARAISEGNLQVRVEPRSERDEFGNAFQRMMAYLCRLSTNATEVSQGNLAVQVQPASEHDALGNAFYKMVDNLRTTITRVTHSARLLAETSRSLNQSTQQSKQSLEQIASQSQQLAQSANEASLAMEELDGALQDFRQLSESQQRRVVQAYESVSHASQAVDEVAQSAEQMSAAAQEATAVAQTGGSAVERVIQAMERIQERTAFTAERVLELDKYGQQIGSIVQTIKSIAQQTNLLALNAAIEAARAGEHGKGFAVVADEVRRLAEQANEATKEIGSLIASVRTGVEQSVQAMHEARTEIETGYAQSSEAGSALREIMQAIDSVAHDAQNVSHLAQQMANQVQQVLEVVEATREATEAGFQIINDIATSSQQVAGTIGTVAHTSELASTGAESLRASAQQVTQSAQELAQLSAQLSELVQQFRHDERTGDRYAA
ncbi:MAG: Cache 3/Cache 2 fusion domain-containing protein, partial [Fimbriimonadales bacterium]